MGAIHQEITSFRLPFPFVPGFRVARVFVCLTMKLLLLSSCLLAAAFAIGDVGVEDADLSNFLGSGSAASGAGSAARWLFGRREEWGPFAPRAVVALSLAEGAGAYTLPEGEWSLLAKQLNVLVSIEVGRESSHQRPLGVSRLSHLVHALLSTCQDPRHFHGLDLVRRLRSDASRKSGEFPIVYLALCLAGDAAHSDLTLLSRMYQISANRTDAQALQLLAMSCITALPVFSSARPIFDSYLREFAARFHASLKHQTTDVYTKALAMQALNSASTTADLSLGVSSLLSDQLPDGSFERSLLATYHAIPALLDTSLLALKNARCPKPNDSDSRNAAELDSPQGSVRVSLWVGEGAERDTHTVTVSAGANDTLLDVMRAASDKNNIFRFSYDETPRGALVYSVAGLPNDSERQTSWQLYVQKYGQNERLHRIQAGVDRVFPSADDVIVFWFKRDPVL